MSYVSRFEVNNCHSYLPLNIMKRVLKILMKE